jgi:asparagine synthase (glutamine-hydrolysing)
MVYLIIQITMCGIFAIIGSTDSALRTKAIGLSKLQVHRGPDWSGYREFRIPNNSKGGEQHDRGDQGEQRERGVMLCHERLAIVDLENGAQPLTNNSDTVWLCVNGEIYNHLELRARPELAGYKWMTNSDCECIIALYLANSGYDWINLLKGDFAFILYDTTLQLSLAARDPIGVCPLYTGFCNSDSSCWYSSEMKTLQECDKIETVLPGTYIVQSSNFTSTVVYYRPTWIDHPPVRGSTQTDLVSALTVAVERRLMADVAVGVLLSGGLDSSLITAIASRLMSMRSNNKWGSKLHSFCIGLPGAPDLEPARKAAAAIGTIHHEFYFTVQDGIDSIPKLIEHLETYDVTTIRASTPMFLITRRIKATGIKVLLGGDASDELFGGYLYFHNAPNPYEFHKETIRRVLNIHYADCLRANKSTMAFGVEMRVPFLDKDFIDVAMNIDPKLKFCKDENGNPRIEKWILRKAFDDGSYLPNEILWRQKEQLSDACGYGWIDSLKAHAEKIISDIDFSKAAERFPYNVPITKEAYWYRQIFEEKFNNRESDKNIMPWIPTWSANTDPSGRVQKVHLNTIV